MQAFAERERFSLRKSRSPEEEESISPISNTLPFHPMILSSFDDIILTTHCIS